MDNFVSYRRFFSNDPNIAVYGSTPEEFQLQRGNPDGNPVVSPMASPAVSDAQLALSRLGSDRIRLGTPAEPVVNPHTGAKMTFVLTRNALTKLRAPVLSELKQVVQTSNSPEIRSNMRGMLNSLNYLDGMYANISDIYNMLETVNIEQVRASKA